MKEFNNLQNLIEIAKGELLNAEGEKQSNLLTLIQSLVNCQYFAKAAGLMDEQKPDLTNQNIEL